MSARRSTAPKPDKAKSLESWIWDAACSIRGAKDAPKYKDNFAEGGGQSAGEWSGATWTAIGPLEGERGGAHQFYTPGEVGEIMARVLDPEPGMEIYDPTCGSGGLLIKCEIAMEAKMKGEARTFAPLKLYGQEKRAWGARFGRAQRARRVRPRRKRPNQYVSGTWAIHDREGQIKIGDAFKNPKFRGKLRTFDRVVACPMEPGRVHRDQLRCRHCPVPRSDQEARGGLGVREQREGRKPLSRRAPLPRKTLPLPVQTTLLPAYFHLDVSP